MALRYIVRINPDYERLRPLIEGIARGEVPPDAVNIYEGRNTLYTTRLGDVQAVVKVFKRPNFINSYVYTTLRSSKGKRSFLNALELKRLGFLTPDPIACIEVRRGLKLVGCQYVCRELSGASEMRHWENFPDADTLLPAFAREMLRLHQAGVWNKDFSPGNILYKGDSASGYEFYYVDLNRMEFGVHDSKKLMRMFRAINLNSGETARLGRLYAEAAGTDPEDMEKEALRQLDGYFATQRRKNFFKRLVGKKPGKHL